jgi:hypothetical protein
MGNVNAILLNSNAAQRSDLNPWNSTTPTSSVFTVSTDAGVNESGSTFVAYCFAPIAGFSAFGSYTGNGSASGPFVYTGFKPRWFMWKNASNVFDWQIVDTARDVYNSAGLVLQPDTGSAEADGRPEVNILSNGFQITTSGSVTNQSGSTFIYACFASNPFKYSNAF